MEKKTHIFGCGIGPLENPVNIEAVKLILRYSDVIKLRDSLSAKWAIENSRRTDIVNSGDPAVGFVKRWNRSFANKPINTPNILNCYLRSWSSSYQGKLSKEEFYRERELFEEQLGFWISAICAQYSLRPRLLAMHHFVIGNDDREFNRRFAHNHLSHLDPVIENRPFSLHQTLVSLQESKLNMAMRFHSILFAHTLEVPFIAIDYTEGGKIYGFLADNNELDRLKSIQDIVSKKWQNYDVQRMI